MAAPMEKTRYTGVFKRGSRYYAIWRAGGKQHRRSCRTLEGARQLRAAMQADVARDEFDPQSKILFVEYAIEWVDRYHGTGRRTFRENTRADYRRHLERFAIPWFTGQVPYPTAPKSALSLSELRPKHISRFVSWLTDERAQAEHEQRRLQAEWRALPDDKRKWGNDPRRKERAAREGLERLARKRARGDELSGQDLERERRWQATLGRLERMPLADATIRNIMCPIRACLRTAVEEELIRHNPTAKVGIPNRERADDDHEDDERDVRALARDELAVLLRLLPERWRLLFTILAATGLRISELVALQWRHLHLDGSTPHVKVRRAIVRGRLGQVKSRYGRRDVPLPFELVSDLRRHRRASEWPGDEHPVFPSMTGTPLDPGNLRRRVLKPVAEEAGVPWCGLHTLRHTCASLLFARGRNVVQVQRWLGHHKASFTLDTYIHLLPGDGVEPLDLTAELAGQGDNGVTPRHLSAGLSADGPGGADAALHPGSPMPTETGRDTVTGS